MRIHNSSGTPCEFWWAVVGAYSFMDNSSLAKGQAFVFDATTGALITPLSNPTPDLDDRFATSVAISEDMVFVGDFRDDTSEYHSGQVYVFRAGGLERGWNDRRPRLHRLEYPQVPKQHPIGVSMAAP